MPHVLLSTGILFVSMAAASFIPLIGRGKVMAGEPPAFAVTLIAALSLLGGLGLAWRHSRRQPSVSAPLPAPVRIALTSCILFLAFCALEFSDGLVNQGGRVFYWTSVLFLPALLLFFGLALAQRWAWWLARIATAILTLWFITFICLIPFIHLQSNGSPIPWHGRLYMITVTSVFAITSGYAFRALGLPAAKNYFGLTSAR